MLPVIVLVYFAMHAIYLAVQAFIAAPIWAVAHVSLSGREFVSSFVKPGYMMIANLFCRIPIAVIGFVFVVLVIDVVLYLTWWILNRALVIDYTGRNTGLIGDFVAIIVIAVVAVSVVVRSIGIIHTLPDRVLSWVRVQAADPVADDGNRLVAVGGAVVTRTITPVAGGASAAAATARRLGGPLQPGIASKLPRR